MAPKLLLWYMPPPLTTAARYCPLELEAMERQLALGAVDCDLGDSADVTTPPTPSPVLTSDPKVSSPLAQDIKRRSSMNIDRTNGNKELDCRLRFFSFSRLPSVTSTEMAMASPALSFLGADCSRTLLQAKKLFSLSFDRSSAISLREEETRKRQSSNNDTSTQDFEEWITIGQISERGSKEQDYS